MDGYVRTVPKMVVISPSALQSNRHLQVLGWSPLVLVAVRLLIPYENLGLREDIECPNDL